MSDWSRDQNEGEDTYTTKTEREVAFKLIAAHALVDANYYDFLRANPREAVAYLHFALDESDYLYLEGKPGVDGAAGVQWDTIDDHIGQIREALHADSVVRSFW